MEEQLDTKSSEFSQDPDPCIFIGREGKKTPKPNKLKEVDNQNL